MDRFYISKTDDAKDLPLPSYMTKGAAGMDLYANVHGTLVIESGQVLLVPTGIKIALPNGYEAQIRPRSGLALKHRIGLLNSPGTIDCDYRGEIKVIVMNFSEKPFEINRGDRIAQMVISQAPQIKWTEAECLPDSERMDGGFGHTGK